eukprot:14961753-Ditylum_brightwellii.AAC.1
MARSLETSLYLSVGSKILLTNSIYQLADFGSRYTGPTFFPGDETRRGWVPDHPVTTTWYTPRSTPGQYDKHTCIMFPLRLAWAWTIWKA